MAGDAIEIRPLSGALGAEVRGVDLAGLSTEALRVIRDAFHEHHALFFRDQKLEPAQQVAFAQHFGVPDVHPIVVGMQDHPEVVRVWKPAGESASFGTGWHSDNSFFDEPSLGTVLYGIEIPPYGGDTLYASMERAYEALSAPLRTLLDGRRAVHSAVRAYDPAVTGEAKYRGEAAISYRYSDAVRAETEHPVVRTHPETGRKCLYVNPMFTQRIVGLSQRESDALLALLYDHATQPDFTCRFRWTRGSVAMWDNRCLQHYALDDYREFPRLMHRVTIGGDRPV